MLSENFIYSLAFQSILTTIGHDITIVKNIF